MEWSTDDIDHVPADAAGDGYVQWERRRWRPEDRDNGLVFHPVFVCIPAGGIPAVLAAADKPDERLLLEKRERAWLKKFAEVASPVRAVVYRGHDRLDDTSLYGIIHIAPEIRFTKRPLSRREGEIGSPPLSVAPGPPIFGVIDDCAPFLNARFRRNCRETRFLAVWLQQLEDMHPDPDNRGEDALFAGPVIERACIEAMMDQGCEADVYRRFHAETLSRTARRALQVRAGHGAHVLDLCCGTDVKGPGSEAHVLETDILAVQLPGEAIGQTDGRRLEGYAMQGLRWIVERAIDIFIESGSPRPLIVNMSLGVTAGPKRGGSFVEAWIAHEIARYKDVTKAEARVVIAYGNAYRSRQIAYSSIPKGSHATVQWRIQPDDRTASHLEVRSSDRVAVTLNTPGGQSTTFPCPLDRRRVLTDDGHIVALVQNRADPAMQADPCGPTDPHVEMTDTGMLVSVAPTSSLDAAPTAPAGLWSITLTNDSDAEVEVSLQIQRDDNLPGVGVGGRQSYLDDEASWVWDPETRDFTAPGDTPITRQATHAADATSPDPQILTVGAARAGRRYRPTRSTASGTEAGFLSRSTGPTVAAVAEDGPSRPGLRGTGVLSGSVVRFGGTSAAAPLVARALARIDLSRHDDVTLLSPRAVEHKDNARLGAGIVDPDETPVSRPETRPTV